MKALYLVMSFILFSTANAAPAKKQDKKKPESVSLTTGLDFDPKKIFVRAKFKPGKNGEQKLFEKITVTNTTKQPSLAKLILYEYNPSEYGKNDVKKSKANLKVPELSLNDMINYPKDVISLNPGESKTIPIEIVVNKSFVGTKYALFTFESVADMVTNPNASRKKSALALELEILGAIILDIVGTGKVEIEQKFVGVMKDRLAVDVENIGDHMLNGPTVEGVLFDSKMNMVDKFQMQTTRLNSVFPQKTKRRFLYHLTKKYPKGKYKLYTQFRAENGTFARGGKFDLEL